MLFVRFWSEYYLYVLLYTKIYYCYKSSALIIRHIIQPQFWVNSQIDKSCFKTNDETIWDCMFEVSNVYCGMGGTNLAEIGKNSNISGKNVLTVCYDGN